MYPRKRKGVAHNFHNGNTTHHNVMHHDTQVQSPINENYHHFDVEYEGSMADKWKTEQAQVYKLTDNHGGAYYHDLDRFIKDLQPDIIQLLTNNMKRQSKYAMKVGITLNILMERKEEHSIAKRVLFHFTNRKNLMDIKSINSISTAVDHYLQALKVDIEFHQSHGSNWKIVFIVNSEVLINHYMVPVGGSHIPSTTLMKKMRCIINPEGNNQTDNQCFKWCILLHFLLPEINHHQQRVSKIIKKYEERPDLVPPIVWEKDNKKVNFPTDLDKDIKVFEQLNPDFAIDVWTIYGEGEKKQKTNMRMSSNRTARYIIPLYLLREVSTIDGSVENFHYCLISNFNRFIGGSHGSHHGEKQYVCKWCFSKYDKEEKLINHQAIFCRKEAIQEHYPTPDQAILEYTNFKNKLETPFYIVADLESVNIPVKKCDCCKKIMKEQLIQVLSPDLFICTGCWSKHNGEMDKLNRFKRKAGQKTTTENEQRACSAAFYVVNTFYPEDNERIWLDCCDKDEEIESFGSRFINTLFNIGEQLKAKSLESMYELDLTPAEELAFQQTNECHICKCPFNPDYLESKLWFKKLKEKNGPVEITEEMSEKEKKMYTVLNKSREGKAFMMSPDKCRDHCHYTGKYRGAAHRCCNLNFSLKHQNWKIPVFFHNMKNYDGHFILQWLQAEALERSKQQIHAIPQNREKFITISLKDFRIIDSFSFFSSSLRTLVENLMGRNQSLLSEKKSLTEAIEKLKQQPNTNENKLFIEKLKERIMKVEQEWEKNEKEGRARFPFLKQEFDRDIGNSVNKENKEEAFKLLFEKGFWAYEWFTSMKQLKQTHLPSIDDYKTKSHANGHGDEWIYGNEMKQEEYNKENEKWKIFNMKTMRDLHDQYLKLDVVLLADVLENRRKQMMRDYGKDFTWHVSLPGYSWDVLMDTGFRMNDNSPLIKPCLELFSTETSDMYLWINKSIRGGNCMIPHRYGKANNKYLGPEKHKPEEKQQYLLYDDANQLYSYAMRQYLPYDCFRWVDESQFDQFTEEFIIHYDLSNTSEKGFIFEVDLEYPSHLHDYHNDYPFAPESIKVKLADCSPFTQHIKNYCHLHYAPTNKLCCTLYDKYNYVVHYRNLRLYLKHGLRLKKIHRILQFRQLPWIKDYIDFNVEKRREAKNDFDKDLYKLMNNAVFGKTMEDEMSRIDFSLVSKKNENKFSNMVRNPNFQETVLIKYNSDLVGISSRKNKVILSKPKTCGFAILDISKELMYQYYYEGLKPVYKDKMKLCMTDTDSLELLIETDDLYKDMKEGITAPIPYLHPSVQPQLACYSSYLDFSNYSLPFKSGINIITPYFIKRFNDYYQYIEQSIKSKGGKSIVSNDNKGNTIWLIEDQSLNYNCVNPSIIVPPTVQLYGINKNNNKVTGKFKDESAGGLIEEFVGLKPKCYSNLNDDETEKATAKGVPKSMLKKRIITHSHYRKVNEQLKVIECTFPKFTAKNHSMLLQKKTMLALTPFDTKRWVLDDNINTRAFGHYKNNHNTIYYQEEKKEEEKTMEIEEEEEERGIDEDYIEI